MILMKYKSQICPSEKLISHPNMVFAVHNET